MRDFVSRALGASALITAFFGSISARADDPVDGSYGRVDGDLSVVFGLGATIAPRAPRPSAELRLRYLDSVGVFCTYEDSFGISTDPRRVLTGGIEIRPLFVGRWLQGYEFGIDRLDLFIDSLGLELGAYFPQPSQGPFQSPPGLQAGLGLELPIFRNANGPWIGLHGGGRWSNDALGGGKTETPTDRSAFLSITLQWHAFFGAHAVDYGDTNGR
jgi:hypothetical protein